MTVAGNEYTPAPRFAFYLRSVFDLKDPERQMEITAEDCALLNPNTGVCPVLRSPMDLRTARRMYTRVPVLHSDVTSADRSSWGFRGLLMYMMNTGSEEFRTADQLVSEGYRQAGADFIKGDACYVPLYEGKMIHQFDHRFGTYQGQSEAQRNQGKLPESTLTQHQDPEYRATPNYWVREESVQTRLDGKWNERWLLVWRDITSPVTARTTIATIVPVVGAGDTLPVALLDADAGLAACFLANLCSYALDYAARQKVAGNHLRFSYFQQLPIVPRETYMRPATWAPESSLREWVLERVLQLVYTSLDVAGFAEACGCSGTPFTWDAERRFHLRAELDAAFCHLYGLEREEVEHVMDSFRIVREREEAAFGEYRTKRLVVAEYVRLAENSVE
jgi:hypothetical protein